MNVAQWLTHPWAELWAEALLHFLWQGTLLTLIAGLALCLRSSAARYAALVALFVAMTSCPVVTVIWLNASGPAADPPGRCGPGGAWQRGRYR